jgi:polysaccharide biosynthesis/export protein
MSPRTHFSLIFTLFVATLLGGCSHYRDLPNGTVKALSSPVVEKQEVIVPPAPLEPPPSRNYVIGIDDVLTVNMNGSDFSTGNYGTDSRSASNTTPQSRVDGEGNIHLPYLGSVKAAGLTVSRLQVSIHQKLTKYFSNPWAVVEILAYRSQPLYLLGQFRNSGTVYMDRPFNLLQGIALGNGFTDNAYLKSARLSRGDKILPVDVYDLMINGNPRQNVWLMPGDTIFIPDNRNQQVYIFGAVMKPGPVPIPPQGTFNLAQAIATAQLRDVGYDFRYVRIIRSHSTTHGELIVVDFDRIMRGETMPFLLQEGDIVYVPRSTFGDWNDAITELLPSLQAISAVLQPFVNMKYLIRN